MESTSWGILAMCGSDMLARINFRMQEIMGNTKFMGGVCKTRIGTQMLL
jgi:hypothetical protein